MQVGGADRHRQRGRLREVKVPGDGGPTVHDRAVRRAPGRRLAPVGGSEHDVTDIGAGGAVPDGLDGARHVDPDAAGEGAREQAPAQRPVGRGKPARVHGYADPAGPRLRNRHGLQAQHLARLPVLVESHRAHRGGRRLSVGHQRLLAKQAPGRRIKWSVFRLPGERSISGA
jgi:hypothetical protein